MDRAALNSLLNLPYDEVTFDCGHLVVLGHERLFGREVFVPTRHPRGRLGQAQFIARLALDLAEPVSDPAHGDVALYETAEADDGATYFHVGLILVMAGERWLLHVRVGGTSQLQRENEARLRGLRLAGFYRLRTMEGTDADPR